MEEARSNPLLAGAAIETSMFAVSVKDREGRYVRANRVYSVLVGIPDDQIQGKTEAQVSARDVAERLDYNDRTALGAGGVAFVEESVLDRVGRRQVASCRFPLVDPAGEPWAVCRVSAPVSDAAAVRKDAERLFALASSESSPAPARIPATEGQGPVEETVEAGTRKAELKEALAAERDAHAAERDAHAAAQKDLAAATRERDDARTDLAAATRERDDARTDLAAATRERNEQLDAVARLEGEVATLRHDRDEQRSALARTQALLERERALIINGEHRHPELAATVAERDEARRQLEAARELIAELQRGPAAAIEPVPAPALTSAAAAEPALATLCHVVAAIDDASSFETGLHQALAALGSGLGFDALVGWRLDVHGERLICSEIWTAAPVMGLEAFATASWRHALNPSEGMAAAAFETRRAAVRSPLSPGSNWSRERDACEAGLVTAIVAPILHGDKPTGLIEAFVSDRRVIEPHVLEAVAAAGRQLGVFAHLLELAEQPSWRAGVRRGPVERSRWRAGVG